MKYFASIFKILTPKAPSFVPPSPELVNAIGQEMKTILTEAYHNKYLNQLYKSVSAKFLLDESVKMYVGSNTCPKNEQVVLKLLKQARQIANPEELKSVQYYQTIFKKINAGALGNQKQYDQASEKIIDLAHQGHAISNYLVGKQMYSTALQMKPSKQRTQMMYNAALYLNASLEKGCLQPFYILGQIFRRGEITKKDQPTAFEYFLVAASYKNPYAYFQLSQYYKKGTIVNKDDRLYMLYLKKAAEMGLPQAQHNLAIQYLNGKHVQKDEVKALGWFVHAAGCGFLASKHNSAVMFLNGTECSKLKPNPAYALEVLKQINGQQGMDVSELIKRAEKKLKQESNSI